ncbi:MAG: hypothetical protein LAT84_07710 [Balneolia bacterium]|nr:hypothetical protein [Balneolia bacterium]
MNLLIPVALSVAGILLAIYKNYLRGRSDVPLDSEPAENRPVEHIKSILFLEVPIERITLGYFALTALTYSVFLISGISVPAIDHTIILLSGVMVFLLQFKWVMAFGVTKRLDWRVLAFLILTTAIGVSLVMIRPEAISESMLVAAFPYNLTAHLLGLVLGLGGAIVLDIMIFHFLKNFTISKREAVIMHLISQMIILGLALLLVSGVALTFTDPETYLENSRFLMKMTAVLVVLINGIIMNLYVAPKMELISLKKEELSGNERLVNTAFVVGAVSAVSWFAVFFLAMIDILETFSYAALLIAYMLILFSAIGGGLITKRLFESKAKAEEK